MTANAEMFSAARLIGDLHHAFKGLGAEPHVTFARDMLREAGGTTPEAYDALMERSAVRILAAAHGRASELSELARAEMAWQVPEHVTPEQRALLESKRRRAEEIRAELADANAYLEKALRDSREFVHFLMGSAWWAGLGFPTFNLTLDFFRSMAVTDLGDAHDDPLPLPFPALLIRLPESIGPEFGTALFVHPLPTARTEEGPQFAATQLHIASTLEEAPYTCWSSGTPVHRLEAGAISHMQVGDNLESRLVDSKPDDDPGGYIRLARRILINTCLYIADSGGLPRERARHGAPPAPVEREHATVPRYRVGRPVKLGAQIRDALALRRAGGNHWKLAQRFIVRGHWRNQAYGPKRSLRQRKWIEPFWKGPKDINDALRRTFEVGTP